MPEILKVKFAAVTLNEAVEKAFAIVANGEKKYITTPNPELLLIANKNPKYLQVLNRSAFNIADGTGILWASDFLHRSKNYKSKLAKSAIWLISLVKTALISKSKCKIIPERVTGVDLMSEICRQSGAKGYKIFLLGAGENVAEKLKAKLEKENPELNISGTYRGTAEHSEEKIIVEKINKSEADILFVAFGSPKQEIWISKNLNKLKSVKLAIGVGGSFDFLSGNKKRAPELMRKMGLEWLFRVIKEPKRIKRIYNATIKFPIQILRKTLKD